MAAKSSVAYMHMCCSSSCTEAQLMVLAKGTVQVLIMVVSYMSLLVSFIVAILKYNHIHILTMENKFLL